VIETQKTFPARDGYPLAGTLYEGPASDGPLVVVHSAAAVPRKIYGPFARFLAARGATVATFDYRGVGDSRPERLRGFPARMRDWAALDAAGVADALVRERPGRALIGVGHSFGGQSFLLQPGAARYRRILMVAAQAGSWSLLAPQERKRVYLLFKAVGPALCAAFGFFPAKRLGLGEDMPAGVFMEWRRWCLAERYFLDDPSLDLLANAAHVAAPVLAVGLADDPWATPPAVDLLVSGLPNAAVERRTIAPAEAGVAKIGHFGLFRAEHQRTLWPELTDWLLDP
jgi:predicted alpha/beta hydrolase